MLEKLTYIELTNPVANSGKITFKLNGIWFTRKLADAYPVATFNQAGVGATGHIADFQTLSTNKAWVDINGSIAMKGQYCGVVTKVFADSPYTVLASDYTIVCNAVGGEITINLPSASGSGRILNISKIDASANNVVIDGASTDKIDADETKTLSSQWSNLQIQDISANQWKIL